MTEKEKEELFKLASHLLQIPSPSGQGKQIVEFIRDYLRNSGLETSAQPIPGEDRFNVVGFLNGKSRAKDSCCKAIPMR